MKIKQVSLIILTILLCFVVQASAVCPAPFERAKAMALTAPKNEDGNHILTLTFNENGDQIIFVLGYIPATETIGVGSSIDMMVFEYCERDGRLTIWTPMGRFSVQEKDREKFFAEAFKIFRSLVYRNLI